MRLAISSTKSIAKAKSSDFKPVQAARSKYAVDEINAYIAIRDQLLAEAEENRTSAKLASTILANDFVEGCLKSARSPYGSQCLPETDAIRERERCEAVRMRIKQLLSNTA